MNRIPYLAHAVKLAQAREAQAVKIFNDIRNAWAQAGQPEDLNRARLAACRKAEAAMEAHNLAIMALQEAQIEAMSDAQRSDHFQALAEIRVGC